MSDDGEFLTEACCASVLGEGITYIASEAHGVEIDSMKGQSQH
jgi:hypothetical protein